VRSWLFLFAQLIASNPEPLKVHRADVLHPAQRCAMLNGEVSQMTGGTKPVGKTLPPANTKFPVQAKKKLIATHAKLEISPNSIKTQDITFSNRNKKHVSVSLPLGASQTAGHGP
jgi:hypothetical protein